MSLDLPSFAHLNHLGPGGHARGGGEQAEARAKRSTAQLEDIDVSVNAVDNAQHDGGGADKEGESQRLKRHLEIGGKVGGTFKIGIAGRGFGAESQEDDRFKRETAGAGEAVEREEERRLKRETGPLRRPRLTRDTSVRLDDVNVSVNAVDNSHHGTYGQRSGAEAERLKRQADRLRHLEIGGEFGGKLKIGFCGDGNGGDSDQDDRLKRQALNGFDDINSDVHADDNWVYA